LFTSAGQIAITGYRLDFVRYVVAFEQRCENAACAEGVRFEGYKDEDRCRKRMMGAEEMGVQM